MTHSRPNLGQSRSPFRLRDTGKSEGITKDSNVGVSMGRNSFEGQWPARQCLQSIAEGEVMSGVRTIQESPIYVKKIAVEAVPGTRTNRVRGHLCHDSLAVCSTRQMD